MLPPLPSNTSLLICIDLVLPMVWVNSPDFFCSASKTVTNNENVYMLDPTSPFAIYPPTAESHHTYAHHLVSPNRMQYINIYIEDLL